MSKMRGWVDIILTNSEGVILEERRNHNLITDLGHAHVADQMSDSTETQMSHMAAGTGSGQSASSTTLATELDRNAFQSGPTQLVGADDNKVQYVGY